MFNKKTEIDAREYHTTQAVTKETIIEKTISPDKVVEMYDKVDDTHAKNLLSAYKIAGNELNDLVWETQTNHLTRQKETWVAFKINNKDYSVLVKLDDIETRTSATPERYVVDEFIKQISYMLSVELLKSTGHILLK